MQGRDGDQLQRAQWGYAPLIVTLANAGEVLYAVNRSGNRPSHADASVQRLKCAVSEKSESSRRRTVRKPASRTSSILRSSHSVAPS